MLMDLGELQVFLMVAREGSFSRAAGVRGPTMIDRMMMGTLVVEASHVGIAGEGAT